MNSPTQQDLNIAAQIHVEAQQEVARLERELNDARQNLLIAADSLAELQLLQEVVAYSWRWKKELIAFGICPQGLLGVAFFKDGLAYTECVKPGTTYYWTAKAKQAHALLVRLEENKEGGRKL